MSGTIWNEDCRTGLSHVKDGSVDLVLMDPPYEFASVRGSGAFGSGNRAYHSELEGISHGIDAELLDLIMSKMRRVNAYVFCSKAQLPFYLGYFSDRGCNFDLLTWHKSNPTPACSNKYLSDTEYIVFARDPGVRLYGSYDTKRKWWVTPVNRRDRELFGHPTVKPLEIVRTLVENSTRGGDVVLDPFIGSGTTAVACVLTGRDYVGFEVDPTYYAAAVERVRSKESEAARAPAQTKLEV